MAFSRDGLMAAPRLTERRNNPDWVFTGGPTTAIIDARVEQGAMEHTTACLCKAVGIVLPGEERHQWLGTNQPQTKNSRKHLHYAAPCSVGLPIFSALHQGAAFPPTSSSCSGKH